MAEKTKLTNAELDIVKERYLAIIKEALNASGEDCDLATAYHTNTLCANMPYVEQGIEGVFEIRLVNKTDPDFDYMMERDNLTQLRKDREAKEKAKAEKKAKQKAEAEKRKAVKEAQKARKEESGE